MVGEATVSESRAILKTKYTQPKVYWLAYMNNPSFATIRKVENFGGENKVVAIQTETPQGAGPDIPTAQANLNPSAYKKFTVTRISDYGVARITGEAMKAAEGNENALLALWKREMDGCIHTVKRSAAIHMWRDGKGARGRLASTANTATDTVALETTTDIQNFSVRMKIQASQNNGGALRSAGATATITRVSRTAGTIGFAAAMTAEIAAAAASDFLYRNGDGAAASTNKMLTGVQGWVPEVAPTAGDNFFGQDRSEDDVRLAGLRLDCADMPMSEALVEALAMAAVEGAEIDKVWLHPRDRATLVKELGARVSYTRVETSISGSKATMGFDALKVDFDGTSVTLMSDLNIPRGRVFPTQWDTWAIESLGPVPHILDYDSNQFLRVTNDDSYEVRVGYYAQQTNIAPAYTVHCFNFGQ